MSYLRTENILIEKGLKLETDIYSPRLDVSVGPIAYGDEKLAAQYDHIVMSSSDFLTQCYEMFIENVRKFGRFEMEGLDLRILNSYNKNARCSYGIEIEESGSRKHHLGEIFNVSALSRVAILIAKDEEILKKFFKTLNFLSYLKKVDKPRFEFKNLFVITEEQFEIMMNSVMQS